MLLQPAHCAITPSLLFEAEEKKKEEDKKNLSPSREREEGFGRGNVDFWEYFFFFFLLFVSPIVDIPFDFFKSKFEKVFF